MAVTGDTACTWATSVTWVTSMASAVRASHSTRASTAPTVPIPTTTTTAAICADAWWGRRGGRACGWCGSATTDPVKFETRSPRCSLLRVSDGGEQRDLRLARVESRVLQHDRHVRLEHRRVVGIARDRLRILEIVEAQMKGAARRHRESIDHRLAIREINRQRDLCLLVGGVQDAGRLMRDQRPVRVRALRRDVALGDGPSLASDLGHDCLQFFPAFPRESPRARRSYKSRGAASVAQRHSGVDFM